MATFDPAAHTPGDRDGIHDKAAPTVEVPAYDTFGVRTIEIGIIVWVVALVGLVPFYGQLKESGHLWWLWTCLAGIGLGLLGLEYSRRRRAVMIAELTAGSGTSTP